MSFTNNLFLDLIIVGIAIIIILVINKIVSSIVKRAKKVPEKRKLIIKFLLRLITALLIIYLLLEGLPVFESLNPEYTAIITSSLSVAIAFASSGIFDNLISGLTLIILNPFELNDVVSIGNTFGAVREIKLTKTVIETFDNIFIQVSNSDVISAKIVKYSLKLEKIENFLQFKQKVRQAEQEGSAPIEEDLEKNQELNLKNVFESAFRRKKSPKIHSYTFIMEFGFQQFRKKLEEINHLCDEYEEIFGFKPRYYIKSFDHDIQVNFRLMTFDSDNFFKYQPEFAKKVYQIVRK
jgi:small-conductance mechanosensitive channel